jgi:hypothetical protein
METKRKKRGFFTEGNRYGKGRIAGSRNKPKEFPFVKEDAVGVSVRRFKTVAARIAIDLGGEGNLTEAQQQLVRRCAMLAVQCELMEAQALEGNDLNAVAYGQLTGHLTRTLNVLGLKREPIDVTPALHHYLDELGQLDQPEPPASPPDESLSPGLDTDKRA